MSVLHPHLHQLYLQRLFKVLSRRSLCTDAGLIACMIPKRALLPSSRRCRPCLGPMYPQCGPFRGDVDTGGLGRRPYSGFTLRSSKDQNKARDTLASYPCTIRLRLERRGRRRGESLPASPPACTSPHIVYGRVGHQMASFRVEARLPPHIQISRRHRLVGQTLVGCAR